MRILSLSAGVTNGVQKAFKWPASCTEGGSVQHGAVRNLIRLPPRRRLADATGFHFGVVPFQLTASSLTALENAGLW